MFKIFRCLKKKVIFFGFFQIIFSGLGWTGELWSRKKDLIMPILGLFLCPVVTVVTFSSNLSNFKKNTKRPKNVQKKSKKITNIQKSQKS